ncbi:unnamed protein product [Caretta caretta]
MASFPFEGTWSLGAVADLSVGTAVDFCTGRDSGTRKESKSLTATNVEGIARAVGIRCLPRASIVARLDGADSGAGVNSTKRTVEVSEWPGVDCTLLQSLRPQGWGLTTFHCFFFGTGDREWCQESLAGAVFFSPGDDGQCRGSQEVETTSLIGAGNGDR